ncbi:MAG: hypothetical protein AAF074_02450 [Pseudomonadota bacterium]
MRRYRPLFLLGLATFAGACTTPVERAGAVRVDGAFSRGGAQWSSGETVDFAVATRPDAGRVAVCGVWTVRSPTARTVGFQERAIATGQVQLAGRTLVRDLTRFPRLADNATLEGAEASCFRTEAPWQESLATQGPEVSFVRLVFDRDTEGLGSSGIIFREIPTVRGAER